MATEKTRTDLVTRVLEVMGVAAAGQSPSAEDVDLVDRQIDSVLASLAARDIVYVADPDAIPLSVFQHVAVLVADEVKSDFGLVQIPNNDPNADTQALRLMAAGRPSYAVLEADYF
jgi:hypothetical protein